jgi:hypothetical protein
MMLFSRLTKLGMFSADNFFVAVPAFDCKVNYKKKRKMKSQVLFGDVS